MHSMVAKKMYKQIISVHGSSVLTVKCFSNLLLVAAIFCSIWWQVALTLAMKTFSKGYMTFNLQL